MYRCVLLCFIKEGNSFTNLTDVGMEAKFLPLLITCSEPNSQMWWEILIIDEKMIFFPHKSKYNVLVFEIVIKNLTMCLLSFMGYSI